MKILITGAGGLVGSEFARQLCEAHDLLPLRRSDLDITDAEAVKRVILRERPALIINCAVLGVDTSELEPLSAWSVNVVAVAMLAKAASMVDAELVHLSSNYVFDGAKSPSFYTAGDVATPINVYGRTKLAGEDALRATWPRHFIVRTSWVFGRDKKNFFSVAPSWLKQGKQVQAITDVWASATYTCDLVSRVLEILQYKRYGVYHIVNDGLCSYYDFALAAARVLNISSERVRELIKPIELSQLNLHAQRPRYTPLRCVLSQNLVLPPLRHWRDALIEHISSNIA